MLGRGKGPWNRSFSAVNSLSLDVIVRPERLAKLKDARANGALIKGGGAANGESRARYKCFEWHSSLSLACFKLGVFLLLSWRRRGDVGLEPQLELGLGGAGESLEDGRVGRVEDDITPDGIGVALKHNRLRRVDGEEMTKLRRRAYQ